MTSWALRPPPPGAYLWPHVGVMSGRLIAHPSLVVCIRRYSPVSTASYCRLVVYSSNEWSERKTTIILAEC